MGYDVSFHPISPDEIQEWYFTPLPGLLTHWPPLSRQQQRPRLFTRELLNNSYLMGAALSRRNERKVGLVDCLGKMNDMPGGMCSW